MTFTITKQDEIWGKQRCPKNDSKSQTKVYFFKMGSIQEVSRGSTRHIISNKRSEVHTAVTSGTWRSIVLLFIILDKSSILEKEVAVKGKGKVVPVLN
jgi:hypothetical protein